MREQLKTLIEGGIPFLQKVAVEVVDVVPGRVRLRFPHDPTNDNYVGTVHAGALFSFGETAAGAAAGAAFDLSRLRMVARRAEIQYRRAVTTELTSTVTIGAEAVATVEQAIERDGRARLPIPVTMENAAGETVCEMTVEYDFRSAR